MGRLIVFVGLVCVGLGGCTDVASVLPERLPVEGDRICLVNPDLGDSFSLPFTSTAPKELRRASGCDRPYFSLLLYDQIDNLVVTLKRCEVVGAYRVQLADGRRPYASTICGSTGQVRVAVSEEPRLLLQPAAGADPRVEP